MANTFKESPRRSMYRYSRPSEGDYINENGFVVTAPQNVIRPEYINGYLWGIKFGDGDSMSIPLSPNEVWRGESTGTLVVTANAPDGYQFFQCGDVTLQGNGTLTTFIVENVDPTNLADTIEIFADEPFFSPPENAHFLLCKWYGSVIDFTQYEEYEAMQELNTVIHGTWS